MMRLNGVEYRVLDLRETLEAVGSRKHRWVEGEYRQQYAVVGSARRWSILCEQKHPPLNTVNIDTLREACRSGMLVSLEIDEGPLHQFSGQVYVLSVTVDLDGRLSLELQEG